MGFLDAGPCPFQARADLPEGRALDAKVASAKRAAQTKRSKSWTASASSFVKAAVGRGLLVRSRFAAAQQRKAETLASSELGGRLEAFMASRVE